METWQINSHIDYKVVLTIGIQGQGPQENKQTEEQSSGSALATWSNGSPVLFAQSSHLSPCQWSVGYEVNPILCPIYSALSTNPSNTFPESYLNAPPCLWVTFLPWSHLTNNWLTYLQPLSCNERALLIIIPPESLCCSLFSALLSSSYFGHLMYYKTLHSIRLHFYWFKLHSDAKQWIPSLLALGHQACVWPMRRGPLHAEMEVFNAALCLPLLPTKRDFSNYPTACRHWRPILKTWNASYRPLLTPPTASHSTPPCGPP
jgi:hypothetical protein